MKQPIGFIVKIPVPDYKTEILPRLRAMETQVHERLRAGDKEGALGLIDAAMKEFPNHPYLKINEQLGLFRTLTQHAGAALRPNLFLTGHHDPGRGAAVSFDFKALGRYMAQAITPRKWKARWFKQEEKGASELMAEKEDA